MKEFNHRQAGAKSVAKNCAGSRQPGLFQKVVPYTEDAYERSEDMRKLDYQRRTALVLDGAFKNSVKQDGCFDPMRKTYGSDGNFPMKQTPLKPREAYGAFRIGNLAKIGYNKTLGPVSAYMEDP